MNDKRVQQIIKEGATTVAEVFHLYDEPKFEDSPEFSGLLEFLKEYAITKIN